MGRVRSAAVSAAVSFMLEEFSVALRFKTNAKDAKEERKGREGTRDEVCLERCEARKVERCA